MGYLHSESETLQALCTGYEFITSRWQQQLVNLENHSRLEFNMPVCITLNPWQSMYCLWTASSTKT